MSRATRAKRQKLAATGRQGWFWLSFCDPDRPAGEQFLGVAIVQAPNEVAAAMVAGIRGCNPGGEVGIQQLPLAPGERIADGYAYRLLDKAEATWAASAAAAKVLIIRSSAASVDLGVGGVSDTETAAASAACVLRHNRRATAVVGLLCMHHLAALREGLQDVLELYALSRLYLPPGSTVNGESKHTKAAEGPAPLRLGIVALSDRRNPATVACTYLANYDEAKDRFESNGPDIPDVPGTLEDYAGWVIEERNLPALTPGWTIAQSVRLLQAHLSWIADQEMVTDLDESVRDLRRALTTEAGDRPAQPLKQAHCSVTDPKTGAVCGGKLWPASDYCSLRCSSCGETIPQEMLAFLGRQYLDSLPKSLTLAEAATLCGVGQGTIRQWVNRHLITRAKDGTYDRAELLAFSETRPKVS